MKRLFSFMMALVLVLSLSVTAFAAEDTGSITITNATIDQTYAPYKIFDASISGGEDSGFIYSITEDNQFFDDMFGTDGKADNAYFTYHADTRIVEKKADAADADVIKYLKALVYTEVQEDTNGDGTLESVLKVKDGLTPEKPAKAAESTEVKFEGLPYGYYLITSTLGTTVTINSTDPSKPISSQMAFSRHLPRWVEPSEYSARCL